MSTDDVEQEAKIREWANANPKFKRFISNMAMLKRLYAMHHKPTKVKDCIEEQEADLELIITKKYPKRKIMLCAKCKRSPGPKETEECGAGDFEEFYGQAYLGGDETGEIKISFPPWFEGDANLKVEEIYNVKGIIEVYNKKVSIKPSEEVKWLMPDISDALTNVQDLLKLQDGEITSEMFAKAIVGYEGDYDRIITELNLVESDGKITVK